MTYQEFCSEFTLLVDRLLLNDLGKGEESAIKIIQEIWSLQGKFPDYYKDWLITNYN